MKARELAEELMKHPDFEVKFDTPYEMYAGCDTYTIDEIQDIVYSNKVIVISGELDD